MYSASILLTRALEQITGTGDLTSLNIASGDEGGEVSTRSDRGVYHVC